MLLTQQHNYATFYSKYSVAPQGTRLRTKDKILKDRVPNFKVGFRGKMLGPRHDHLRLANNYRWPYFIKKITDLQIKGHLQ